MANSYAEYKDALDFAFPYILSLMCLLAIFQLLDVLQIVYYPMIHRITETARFELNFSLSVPLLLLLTIWIYRINWKNRFVSNAIPVIALIVYPIYGLEGYLSIVSLLGVTESLFTENILRSFLSGIFLFLGFIKSLALIHWTFFIPLGWDSPLKGFAWLENGLSSIAGYLVPLLVVLLLFMWFLKPVSYWALGRKWKPYILKDPETKIQKKTKYLLVLTLILGFIASIYPYNPVINPEGENIGVDIGYYEKWVEAIEGDLSQSLVVANGTRPLFILFIYGLKIVSGFDLHTTITFLPALLIPLLTISVFFLSFEIFKDYNTAIWACFFTVCSYHVTTGMYSFFLANILGLTLIYFSIGFLLKSLRHKSNFNLIIATLLAIISLLIHAWTVYQYIVPILLFTIYNFYKKIENQNFRNTKFLALYISIIGIFEFIKYFYIPGINSITIAKKLSDGIFQHTDHWFSSIYIFRIFYGDTLSIFTLILFALIGVFYLNLSIMPHIILIIFQILTSLLFIIVETQVKSRLFFNFPIGILASYGFTKISQSIKFKTTRLLLLMFVILSMIVNLFRTLANLL